MKNWNRLSKPHTNSTSEERESGNGNFGIGLQIDRSNPNPESNSFLLQATPGSMKDSKQVLLSFSTTSAMVHFLCESCTIIPSYSHFGIFKNFWHVQCNTYKVAQLPYPEITILNSLFSITNHFNPKTIKSSMKFYFTNTKTNETLSFSNSNAMHFLVWIQSDSARRTFHCRTVSLLCNCQ